MKSLEIEQAVHLAVYVIGSSMAEIWQISVDRKSVKIPKLAYKKPYLEPTEGIICCKLYGWLTL